MSTVALLALAVAVGGPLLAALAARPQRGLLLLAALLPLDGLLLVVPGGASLGAWKEALLLATLLATLVAPPAARRRERDPLPSWVAPLAVLVVLGAVSAVVVGGVVGVWGFKISFFYVLVPVVLWRCPFGPADRDRLVTVLMATGAVTAAVGLAQQVVGAERLHALGYDYNTAIRFSGSLLRSFSTFTQPFSFGLFLSLVLLVCLPVAMADARRPRNLAFLVASPALVLAMAASVVRGAALGLLAGLLVLMVWRFRGLFHAFVPVGLALLLVPAPVAAAYFSSSSLDERATGWSTILDRVVAAPLGGGVGTTGAAAEKSLELGADPDRLVTVDGALYLPDNQYVKTVLELGPIGLWLLVLLGAAVVSAAAAAARRTTGDDQALAQGIAAAVVGAAAASFVSTYLEIFPLDFYLWLLIGVLTCLTPESRSTPSPSVPAAAASRPTSVSSSGP